MRSTAVTLLSVLALAVQCLAVQTHIEGLAGFGAGALAHPIAADPSRHIVATANAPIDPARGAACVICQEIARAGAGILVSSPALALAESYSVSANAVRLAAQPRIVAAHSWQSRAPPLYS